MILGAEIAMIVLALSALVSGKLVLAKTKVVTGPLARQLAFILLVPVPLAYTAHGFIHAQFVQQGKPVGMSSGFYWTCVAVEGGIVVLCLAAVYGIGWFSATDPTARQDTAGSGPDDLGSPDWIPEQGRDERALHH